MADGGATSLLGLGGKRGDHLWSEVGIASLL